jgi:hypothetical protein
MKARPAKPAAAVIGRDPGRGQTYSGYMHLHKVRLINLYTKTCSEMDNRSLLDRAECLIRVCDNYEGKEYSSWRHIVACSDHLLYITLMLDVGT